MKEGRRATTVETNTTEKGPKKSNVKAYQVILMIITLVIAVFVVIQVIHMVNYTLGNEMDINKMWLFKWLVTVTK